MIQFTIDGQAISVPKGTTVYKACRELGIDIPIFCYQDRMPPFGACRVCLVEVEKMPKLQTSCTLEATEGMVVKTGSDGAAGGRKEILEFLLINHPLDCPICDKGGECPLQDQAFKFGPGKSHFYEEKRHFKKPIPLGPVLMLDRERCIQCARCTRFGDIVAGDHALQLLDRGYRLEVGTPSGGPVESKFIGNTISICPVGALTSRPYRFQARPWDNTSTNSTCTLCPVGCSMILDARDGEIMRTRAHENKKVNDMWLCDKGWFGYEFAGSDKRLKKPLIRRNGKLEEATFDEALSLIASKIKGFKGSGKLAGWGGNPLTTEENYLFQKLMRTVCGVDHVDHRIGSPIFKAEDEGLLPGMEIEIEEMGSLSTVYLLGVDLSEDFPLLWLRLREAMNKGTKVIFIGHYAPEIAQYMDKISLHRPEDALGVLKEHLIFEEGKKGALFVGSQYLASPQRKAILSHLLNIKKSKQNLSLNLLEGRGNSMGARIAGMRPDLLPLGIEVQKPGLNAVEVLKKASESGWDFLYVAGANPAKKFPSKLWKEAREKTKFLVVQDLFLTETAESADVVLPALNFMEKRGTFINIEGRTQKLHPGKEIPIGIWSDEVIFTALAEKMGTLLSLDAPFLERLREERLLSSFPEKIEAEEPQKTAPGEFSASFAHALFDDGVRMQHNPHLIQMAIEPPIRLNPKDASSKGIKEGDAIVIKREGISLKSKAILDPKVAEGVAVLPLGFEKFPVHDLEINLLNGLGLQIVKEVGTNGL